MHLTVYYAISVDAKHPNGICHTCGSPLMQQKGAVNRAGCIVQLYCFNCDRVCADSPIIDDLQPFQGLLASAGVLMPGNLGGVPEPLRRILARE